MKRIIAAIVLMTAAMTFSQPSSNPTTYCNPLNLNYPFVYSTSHRETGEPTPIKFQGDYYLFASYLDGYWWSNSLSNDFSTWTFVPHTTQTIPLMHDGMHLCVWEYNGYLYIEANEAPNIYRTNDPKSGKAWEFVTSNRFQWDPCAFKGYDGYYYMTAAHDRISRLDPADNWTYGQDTSVWASFVDGAEYGWQLTPSDRQTGWQEGSNMFMHNGRYYFEWSTPGTDQNEYCEGVKVLDSSYAAGSPLGKSGVDRNGWKMQAHNPFSFKPTGFICGPGHGQLFEDQTGIWKFSTMNVSIHPGWERLLGMTAAYIDANREVYCDHVFGDYPQYIPGKRPGGVPGAMGENLAGWMLLSYSKPATASSALSSARSIDKAFDESVQTYWSAATGNAGEWLRVDMQKSCTIRSIQTAFADEGITTTTPAELYMAYKIEISQDDQAWSMLIDKTAHRKDLPYDYVELAQPATARYVKITNTHMSGLGKFAISGFRIFGSANGNPPAAVGNLTINRNSDRRICTVTWPSAAGAFGYSLRFGVAPDKLYLEYQALKGKYIDYPSNWISYHIHDTTITFNSLNRTPTYYFRVDAFNENGVTKGTVIKSDQGQVVSNMMPQARTMMNTGIQAHMHNGRLVLSGLPAQMTGDMRVTILDAQGRLVAEKNVPPRTSVDISVSLRAQALYFVTIAPVNGARMVCALPAAGDGK